MVDDNRDGADSLAMMLRLLGNEVRTAHDGLEAVEAAEQFRPEVILMDVGMPRLNGLDATRRIREQPWGDGDHDHRPTGWGQEGDREQSREAGCDGHLVKPVNLPDLEKLLADLAAEYPPMLTPLRPSLLLVLALPQLAIVAVAAKAERDIWNAPVMKQPFDKQPFRQIRVPAWVQETRRLRLHALGAWTRRPRTPAAKHGVTISEMGFVDPFYAYYDSKLLKRRSPHVPLDRLEKDIAEYKKLGVRILGVYPPCLQGEVYETASRLAANRDEHDRDPARSI